MEGRAGAIEYRCTRCGTTNRIPRQRVRDNPICGRCKARLFGDEPLEVTDATFAREVEQSPLPTLVDFWAPWCGPCRTVGPVLREIAAERAGELRVVKVNVDENPMVSSRFGIRSIPALKLFIDGQVATDVVGAMPKGQLLARIGPYLR